MVGGCPLYNKDLDWARATSLVNQIADTWKNVAAQKGVQYLDLRGHRQRSRGLREGRAAIARHPDTGADRNGSGS